MAMHGPPMWPPMPVMPHMPHYGMPPPMLGPHPDVCGVGGYAPAASSRPRRTRSPRQRSPPEVAKQKFTCRFMVGIDNDDDFRVVRRIIGAGGAKMKEIVAKTSDQAKLRLRGKGSGFVERDIKAESQEPLQLCISCPSKEGYDTAVQCVEELLKEIYEAYTQHCMAKGMPDPAMEVTMTERHTNGAKGARKPSPDVFSDDDNGLQTPKKRRGGGRSRRPKAASQAPALPAPAAAAAPAATLAAAPVAAPVASAVSAPAVADVPAAPVDVMPTSPAAAMHAGTVVPPPAVAVAMPGAPLVTTPTLVTPPTLVPPPTLLAPPTLVPPPTLVAPPTLVTPMPAVTPPPLAATNGLVSLPYTLGTAASALKAKATPPSLTPPPPGIPLHDLPQAPLEQPLVPLPPLNNPCGGCNTMGPRPLPTPENPPSVVGPPQWAVLGSRQHP